MSLMEGGTLNDLATRATLAVARGRKLRLVRRTKTPAKNWRRIEVKWKAGGEEDAIRALRRETRGLREFLDWRGISVPRAGARVVQGTSERLGVSVRVIEQYDIAADKYHYRFDVVGR